MKQRTGFTLIEVLVVIMIITMLAGMTLSAVGSARNAASAARTRATIEKINRVIMKQYASYQYRKVDIGDTSGYNKKKVAEEKLKALRALIRHEMPDRAGDLNAFSGETLPSVTQMFKSKFNKSSDSSHASAELLYMIVMADPVGSGMFSEGEVGDTDKDGLPEFLDGWGRPIRYILWPAGFFRTDNCETDLQVTVNTNDSKFVHDPFDTANLEPGSPALYPLIYSAGPDGIYDINRGTTSGSEQNTFNYSSPLNPMTKDGDNRYIGQPWNDTDGNNRVLHHFDNITNHSMLSN
ncbi:MAG: prepilin-type N-terminal cleavage/methylation domain-containing protein [Thermoguttaceae bacterium]|nr:prepilin-type N-terminal cleavage/methylation domain-containing protein [Thermoguttaceae bacterium]